MVLWYNIHRRMAPGRRLTCIIPKTAEQCLATVHQSSVSGIITTKASLCAPSSGTSTDEEQVAEIVHAGQGAWGPGTAAAWQAQAGKAVCHGVRPQVRAQDDAVDEEDEPVDQGLGALRLTTMLAAGRDE